MASTTPEKASAPPSLEELCREAFLSGEARDKTAERILRAVADAERRQNHHRTAELIDAALGILNDLRAPFLPGSLLVPSRGFFVTSEVWDATAWVWGGEAWSDSDACEKANAFRDRVQADRAELKELRSSVETWRKVALAGAAMHPEAVETPAEVEGVFAEIDAVWKDRAEELCELRLERTQLLLDVARLNRELDAMAQRAVMKDTGSVCEAFAAAKESVGEEWKVPTRPPVPDPGPEEDAESLPETFGTLNLRADDAEMRWVVKDAPQEEPPPVRMKTDAEMIAELPKPAQATSAKAWTLSIPPEKALEVARLMTTGTVTELDIAKRLSLTPGVVASVRKLFVSKLGPMRRMRPEEREAALLALFGEWRKRPAPTPKDVEKREEP